MVMRVFSMAALLLVAGAAAAPAHALSMSDCSAKYKAAEAAGTLKGMTWNDFRKAECRTTAAAASTSASGEPTVADIENAKAAAPTRMAAPRGVTFPKAVDPKFARETAGKARMHTCLEEYKANKANNTLNGLRWIQKGGGYYSMCAAKLKG